MLRLISTVLLLVILNAPPRARPASEPYPEPWFIEHFALGSVELPSGVTVALVPRDSGLATESITIGNSTATPLYVVGRHDTRGITPAPVGFELPEGVIPLNQAVDGRAYKWAANLDEGGSAFAWVPADDARGPGLIWLDAGLNNYIESSVGVVVELSPVNHYGGNRPNEVTVPKPQDATLVLVYGGRQIMVPLEVSYSLNPAYHSLNWAQAAISPDSVFYCVLGVFAAIAGAGITWVLRRRASRAPAAE